MIDIGDSLHSRNTFLELLTGLFSSPGIWQLPILDLNICYHFEVRMKWKTYQKKKKTKPMKRNKTTKWYICLRLLSSLSDVCNYNLSLYKDGEIDNDLA